MRIFKIILITLGIIGLLIAAEMFVSYAFYDFNSKINISGFDEKCISKETYNPKFYQFQDQRNLSEIYDLAKSAGYYAEKDEGLGTLLIQSDDLSIYIGKNPDTQNWHLGAGYRDCETPNRKINNLTKEVLKNLKIDSGWIKFYTYSPVKSTQFSK